MADRDKTFIASLLEEADIRIGGDRDWDIQVHDDRLYARVLAQGTLGLGEAYMEGWWDSPRVDQFIHRIVRNKLQQRIRVDINLIASMLRGRFLNMQRWRAYEVGRKHYDLSNRLYEKMLDARMVYSCGYWREAETLDQAQEAKLDLICRKAGLEKGMKVLDIGSGWGGFLKFAAERYGIEGIGVTVSKEQHALSIERAGGLPVEYRLADYGTLEGRFDRVISIGMFEHVGYKNYPFYMQKVRDLLTPGGHFVLHTIGGNASVSHGDPWTEKYIFPNGMLPSVHQIGTSIEGRFVMEDWHNFGADYDRTLMAWHANFEAAWPELEKDFDPGFYRMWRYYLLSFAGLFRARGVQLWQIVLSPDGVDGVFPRIS